MENQLQVQEATTKDVYAYAANLMVNEQKNSEEVVQLLNQRGLDQESAWTVVRNLESHIEDSKKEAAKKDMLYGALWCVGGTIATFANVGFIFWGAILFGGIQFFKGLFNYNQ